MSGNVGDGGDYIEAVDAVEAMRRHLRAERIRPIVQRYELERRIERCEDALAAMRVEFSRCRINSAGVVADVGSIMAAGDAMRNHIAHLRALLDSVHASG